MDTLKGIEVCFRPWSDSDEKDTAYPLYFFLILVFTILSLSYYLRFFFWFLISSFLFQDLPKEDNVKDFQKHPEILCQSCIKISYQIVMQW